MSDGDMSPAAGEPSSAPWPDSPTRPDDTPGAEIPGGFHDEFPELGLTAKASGPPVISAEWALWGKEAHETGYHVLRCSKRRAARPGLQRDHHPVLARASSTGLPQYTVSWIPGADREPEYVAIGIHEPAPADPRPAGRRSRRDAVGREIVFVRLFCMRYADLAEHAASYQDLVRAAQDVQFPVNSGREVGLTLAAAPSPIIARGTAREQRNRSRRCCSPGDQVCVARRRRRPRRGAAPLRRHGRWRCCPTACGPPCPPRPGLPAPPRASSSGCSSPASPRAGGRLADGRAQAGDRLVEWANPDDIHVTGEAALLYQDWLKECGARPRSCSPSRPGPDGPPRCGFALRTSAAWSVICRRTRGSRRRSMISP